MYTSEHLIADTCDRIDPVHFIARYECLVKSMFSYVYASRTPSSGSRHWPHPVSTFDAMGWLSRSWVVAAGHPITSSDQHASYCWAARSGRHVHARHLSY